MQCFRYFSDDAVKPQTELGQDVKKRGSFKVLMSFREHAQRHFLAGINYMKSFTLALRCVFKCSLLNALPMSVFSLVFIEASFLVLLLRSSAHLCLSSLSLLCYTLRR